MVRARGGTALERQAFVSELAAADAVCVGETHSNPHDHWVQLGILKDLGALGGKGRGVGFEMFQQPFQGVLDDWLRGAITEEQLLTRTGWQKRWGFDFALYRRLLVEARNSGMDLVALRISDEDKEKFKKASEGERKNGAFPEIDLGNKAHRDWFWQQMGGHSHGARTHGKGKEENHHHPHDDDSAEGDGHDAEGKATDDPHHGVPGAPPLHGSHEPAKPVKDDPIEKMYAVQVLWDESMADASAKWLAAQPGRKLVIIAGKGHCHDSAIVGRLKRRGDYKVVSVQPVIDDGKGNVAALLAAPLNDYLIIMRPPARSSD